MSNKTEEAKAMVFYRVVKALPGHRFAGLYAVEKVFLRNDTIYKREIAHEWDLRAFSEAALARLGGSTAYDSYKEDHIIHELYDIDAQKEVKPRTEDQLKKLTDKKVLKDLPKD